MERKRGKRKSGIPDYTLGEEIFNAVSHGLGALLSVAGLVLLLVRAQGALAVTTAALFGASMILLYTMSCLYHALSPRTPGKRVLRVLDHCNVFLLVFGTYVPVSLLGVGGAAGWTLFGVVAFFTVLGVALTAIDLERFQAAAVLCELGSGWSILLGLGALLRSMGARGLLCLILGGVLYSIGAVLYALGAKKRWRHSVFHVFCLLGTFFHFWSVYQYLL
ncbi:MAG: hemolysin III family protein [Oscillospiraceae bacterium]|nr:hemolysin III family protein [Oscillospiraceae bacterium]